MAKLKRHLPAALTLCLVSSNFCFGEEPPSPLPPAEVILEKAIDLPSPKLNAKVSRIIFPPGYKTPLHTHEGPGPRYVLRGKLRVEESGQAKNFGAGEIFWETGQWITVENTGPDEAEILSVELATRK